MNDYFLTCQYCGNSWETNYIPRDRVYCSKCNDSAIKIKERSKEKVDFYEGCPPFPEKPTKDDGWPFTTD